MHGSHFSELKQALPPHFTPLTSRPALLLFSGHLCASHPTLPLQEVPGESRRVSHRDGKCPSCRTLTAPIHRQWDTCPRAIFSLPGTSGHCRLPNPRPAKCPSEQFKNFARLRSGNRSQPGLGRGRLSVSRGFAPCTEGSQDILLERDFLLRVSFHYFLIWKKKKKVRRQVVESSMTKVPAREHR